MSNGPRIVLADELGMCAGLRVIYARARREVAAGDVYVFGDFVHNPRLGEQLVSIGAKTAPSVADVPKGSRVLVGPHGSHLLDELDGVSGANVLDTRCRRVDIVISAAIDLADSGRKVVFVGRRGHEEHRAIEAAIGPVFVVGDLDDVDVVPIGVPVGAVSQSTESLDVYEAVVAKLANRVGDVAAAPTTCPETERRRRAAERLGQAVDLVVVVGGPDSHNTRRLADAAGKHAPTVVVNSAAQVADLAVDGLDRVGVTAGASTPDEVLAEVIAALEQAATTTRFDRWHRRLVRGRLSLRQLRSAGLAEARRWRGRRPTG